MYSPVLQQLKSDMGDDMRLIKIDVDRNEEIAQKLGIRSMPTTIIFQNGDIKFRAAGVQSIGVLKAEISIAGESVARVGTALDLIGTQRRFVNHHFCLATQATCLATRSLPIKASFVLYSRAQFLLIRDQPVNTLVSICGRHADAPVRHIFFGEAFLEVTSFRVPPGV